MKKRVIVLGSTGSIGRSTLDVLDNLRDEWDVVGLAAGSRAPLLAEQARRFHPQAVALVNGEAGVDMGEFFGRSAGDARSSTVKSACAWDFVGNTDPAYRPTCIAGEDALVRLIEEIECDCVVSAVVGAHGLNATLRAVELGLRVALANKEALVIAGALLVPLAKKAGAELLPIDSEHSAIFQALHAGRRADVHKIHLTTSGGPFRTWTPEQMDDATLEDALRHPTWEMGPKITIDSATMMNKALEIVEARWLFDVHPDQIEVIVHPESVVHSMVEFTDGSVIAQLGTPDMRTPIQYALTYPARQTSPSARIDWSKLRQLNFHPPDEERFPALRLGHEVAAKGGTSGAVLNAANEAAVELFRAGAIHYRDIVRLVARAVDEHDFIPSPGLDELWEADRRTREEVTKCITC
jgi:1-deoxy-D-xylulose-5-phosphate reductoisomerase